MKTGRAKGALIFSLFLCFRPLSVFAEQLIQEAALTYLQGWIGKPTMELVKALGNPKHIGKSDSGNEYLLSYIQCEGMTKAQSVTHAVADFVNETLMRNSKLPPQCQELDFVVRDKVIVRATQGDLHAGEEKTARFSRVR